MHVNDQPNHRLGVATSNRCCWPVPAETARIARAAFPKGNSYLRLRDELGSLYTDEALAAGVFGAPSYVLPSGEIFWGQDRLELLERALKLAA